MDKITFEIVRSGLYSVAREMKVAMIRTAGSPIIHSGGDASAAIFDANMQLVAQGNDIPTMMGSAVISTKASVEAIGVENLRPGDTIISNDVYLGGGNHQPDVQLTRPVFHKGKIIAYTMTRGHWVDIGGTAPGSFTPVTWDVHAEGIRIPPVILYRDDKPVEDLFRLIVNNTRDQDTRMLDINAQYAGCFVGAKRIEEMAEKVGPEALAEAMKEALDYSEKLMRTQIERIPDGVYEGSDFIEPVQATNWDKELIPVKVKVTVKGDKITFDYTGTAPQVRGGVNCPFSVTCNSTWFTVKTITDHTIPINQGCYRPIEIICPEGTLLNCTYPASVVSGVTETSPRIIDMLLETLAPALPERVVAQSNDAACSGIFSGKDPDAARVASLRREHVQYIDPHAGGYGARPMRDGVNAIRALVGNAGMTSVEQVENFFPLTIESWALVTDSGGAGRWRGGLTAERTYKVHFDEANLTVIAERGLVPPKGLLGGKEGSCFKSSVTRSDNAVESIPSKGGYVVVHRDDVVRVRPAGSGGYGNPTAREPARVLDDLRNGYISENSARDNYGVVVDTASWTVDEEATAALRMTMAQGKETASA